MTKELLDDLINNINKIYTTTQYDYIQTCCSLLNIKINEFEKRKARNNLLNYFDNKDYHTSVIIKTIEKELTDEQKEYFYNKINNSFIIYTNSEIKKLERIKNIINSNTFKDYNNMINIDIINTVASLNNESEKIDFIQKYHDNIDEYELPKIITSLVLDSNKLKYIEEFSNDSYSLGLIISSLHSDELKIKLFNEYSEILKSDNFDYYRIASTFKSEELKLKAIEDAINNKKSYNCLIDNIYDEKSILYIWDKVDLKSKTMLIYNIQPENKKVDLLKKLNESFTRVEYLDNIAQIISNLSYENKMDILLHCLNIGIDTTALIELMQTIDNEQSKIDILKLRGDDDLSLFSRFYKVFSPQTIMKNIDLFLERENVSNKNKVKEYIQEMFTTNNEIVYTIKWELLNDKYVNTLGLDKINLIASFKDLTKLLCNMTDKDYEAFYRCLDHYIENNGSITWQYFAYQIMEEIYFNRIDHDNGDNFLDLINDFNNVNIDNLLYILLNGDTIGIKSVEDINNYDKLMIEKCNRVIINGNLDEKKNAIFYKYFGLSDENNMLRGFRGQIKNGIFRIYRLYNTDIHLIEDESIKEWFQFIETIINSESSEELIDIYNNINEFKHFDTYKFERILKNELLKLYNKELIQLDDMVVNKEGMYEAGVNFSMIVTSVGAYVNNTPENYMNDWNRASLASNHFCASFIRNDMLGTAPVPHFLYGFTKMEPYSLLLSGSNDVYSDGKFISKAYDNEMYYAPNTQINKVASNYKFKYNEMDFSRIQNDKRKQPDYILVFRKDGIIKNIEEAKKASLDWNGLPIVVVDVDLCLASEKNKVQEILNSYYQLPTQDIYEKLKTKILNNRITDEDFMSNIDLVELEHMINKTISK